MCSFFCCQGFLQSSPGLAEVEAGRKQAGGLCFGLQQRAWKDASKKNLQ